MMVLDAADRIIYTNPALAALFAVPADSFPDKRPLEAIRLVELAELVEAVRKTGKPQSREMKVVFPDEKILLGSANLVLTESGSGVAIVIQDISEVKRLENLRQEFVANVSHELKTPLTAIKSYAETLLHGAIDDPENNRKFLQKIEKNVQQPDRPDRRYPRGIQPGSAARFGAVQTVPAGRGDRPGTGNIGWQDQREAAGDRQIGRAAGTARSSASRSIFTGRCSICLITRSNIPRSRRPDRDHLRQSRSRAPLER